MPDHDPSRADGAAELMRNEVGEVLVGVDGDACGFLDLAHVGMVVDEVGHALAAAGGGRHLLPAVGAGEPVPSTTCFEITTSSTPSRLGRSNMVSRRMLSRIERRPRAPVLRSIALRAMAPSASSARLRSTLSISNSRWYCFISAFFGSIRMRLSADSSRSSRVATTG